MMKLVKLLLFWVCILSFQSSAFASTTSIVNPFEVPSLQDTQNGFKTPPKRQVGKDPLIKIDSRCPTVSELTGSTEIRASVRNRGWVGIVDNTYRGGPLHSVCSQLPAETLEMLTQPTKNVTGNTFDLFTQSSAVETSYTHQVDYLRCTYDTIVSVHAEPIRKRQPEGGSCTLHYFAAISGEKSLIKLDKKMRKALLEDMKEFNYVPTIDPTQKTDSSNESDDEMSDGDSTTRELNFDGEDDVAEETDSDFDDKDSMRAQHSDDEEV